MPKVRNISNEAIVLSFQSEEKEGKLREEILVPFAETKVNAKEVENERLARLVKKKKLIIVY
jgi:hypothetical protein